ncbi:MAG: hypothetical protein ACSLFQ_09940 [Thermoanaerobaculia bacterium]
MADDRSETCTSCGRSIFSATAKATGGLCRPCVNRQAIEAFRTRQERNRQVGLDREYPYTDEEVFAIASNLKEGRTEHCKGCGGELIFKGVDSGVHPGIYCPNGCTEILFEMRPRPDR